MRAIDVMTPNVITVDPDTSVQGLATLLSERGISGAPVVDSNGRMIGIVSEGDLLHRTELGTERHGERRQSWWLDHFASGEAREYVKSHGRTVKDIMTRDVVTVTEETNLADVATLLETNRVKRVPVMRDGKVVGIISRANLVRALSATMATPPADAGEDDRAIRTNSSPSWRNNHGRPRSGHRTSSSAAESFIYGLARTNLRRDARRYGLPPRTSLACAASRSVSCQFP